MLGADYTIVDISAWGWLDRAGRVLKKLQAQSGDVSRPAARKEAQSGMARA